MAPRKVLGLLELSRKEVENFTPDKQVKGFVEALKNKHKKQKL